MMDSGRRDRSPPARRRLWRHPAAMALGAALAIIVASFVPTLWHLRTLTQPGTPIAAHDAPWEADVAADGAVRALGLRLPGSTLGDASALWGEALEVALMVSPGSSAALEALVDRARPGGIAGRLVLTAQASASQLRRWQAQAVKDEPVSAQTRRLTLRSDDLAEAMRAPLTSIGFIPQVQLDADVVRRRFGEPEQVIVEGEAREHWLYPGRGLALVLDANDRELLQFVAPAHFDALLKAPLLEAVRRRADGAPEPGLRTSRG